MYVGDLDKKQLISIALMILFTMTAMFFTGYRYAYAKSVDYANEQIEQSIEDFKMMYGLQKNPDVSLGNIEFPDFVLGGKDEEQKHNKTIT